MWPAILCNRLHFERDRLLYPEISRPGNPGAGFYRWASAQWNNFLAHFAWRPIRPSGTADMGSDVAFAAGQQRPTNNAFATPAAISRCCAGWRRLFERVHATGADLPQECVSLMSPTFLSDQFDTMYNRSVLSAWFFGQDLRPAYEFHRRFLQHLPVSTISRAMDPKGAGPHVFRPASVDLSGRQVRAAPPRSHRSSRLGFEFAHNSATCFQ